MATEIDEYIAEFDSLHNQILEIIDGMSHEEFHWAPIPDETNSPAVLLTLLLGAESFRVHEMAGGININRNRDSEFLIQDKSVDQLKDTLRIVSARTKEVLQGLDSGQLEKIQPAVREYEGSEAVRWHILHAIEHYGIHIGHLTLTHQLYVRQHSQSQ